MSTTVHLPPQLLASVDHQAHELGMSRNRYIIRALKHAVETETQWSPQFIAELEAAREDEDTRQEFLESMRVVTGSRTRKPPPPAL